MARVWANVSLSSRVVSATARVRSETKSESSPAMGKLVEDDATETIFTRPAQKQTEDYITGRFG